MENIIITDKQVDKILQRLKVNTKRDKDGIAVVDLQGTIRYVDSYWAEVYGCNTTDEMVGKHISAFHPQERAGAIMVPLMKEPKQRNRLTGLVERVQGSGTAFGIKTKIVAVKNTKDNVIGLVVFAKSSIQNDKAEQTFNNHKVEQTITNKQPKNNRLEECHEQIQGRVESKKNKPSVINNKFEQRIIEHEQVEQDLSRRNSELTLSNDELQRQITQLTVKLESQKEEAIAGIKAEYEEQLSNVKSEAEQAVMRETARADESIQQAAEIKAEFEQALAETRFQAEEKERLNRGALAKAEERAKSCAETAAKAEEKLKAETSELIIANERLQDQITEELQAEDELRHYSDQLHQQVAEHEQVEQDLSRRNSELTLSNDELQRQITQLTEKLKSQTEEAITGIKAEYEERLSNVKSEAERAVMRETARADESAQQAAETKAELEQALAEARFQVEEKERLSRDALAKAEERAKSCAETAAKAEEKLKAEIEARLKVEENAKTLNLAKAKAEEKSKTEAKARAQALQKVKSYANEIVEFQKKLEAEAKKRIRVRERLKAKLTARAKRVKMARAMAKAKIEAYAKKTEQIRAKASKEIIAIQEAKVEALERAKSYSDEIAELQKRLKVETEKRLKVKDRLKARLVARAKRVVVAHSKAKAKIEAHNEKTERVRAEAEEEIANQKALLEAQTSKVAELKAELEAKTKSFAGDIEQLRAEARLQANSKAEALKTVESYADKIAELQKRLKVETEKRLKVKDKLKARLVARAKRVSMARAKAKAKIESYAKKTERVRAEAEEEIANQKALLEAQTAKIAELKAELEAKTKSFAGDIEQARAEARLQANSKAEERIKVYTTQIDELVTANEKLQNEIISQSQTKDVLENLEQRIVQQITELPSTREKLEQEITKCQQIEQCLVRQADELRVGNKQIRQGGTEHVYVQQHKADQHPSGIAVEEKFYKTSLRDLYYVFFRHKWKMALFFFTITIIVTVATFLSAKVYQSEAKLLVRLGRESVTLDPTAATGQIIQISQSRENEINSELEILKSRELIEKVVDSIGAKEFVKRPEAKLPANDAGSEISEKARWIFSNPIGTFHNLLQRFGIVEPMRDHDKAVLTVTKNLKIENPKDNSIINISYEATNPKLAQEVVAKFIDLYLEKHIAAHQTPGSHQFFIQQSTHLREKLVRVENELRNLKNTTGISSIEKQKEILLNRIGTLKQDIDSTEASLAFSTAKANALQKTLNNAPETMKDLVSEEANISSLQAQINVKKKKFPDAQAELKALNNTEVKIRSLERELEIQEANYRKYSENLEQARIDHAMENEKISNISVVQSATFPMRPIRPRKLFNLLLGLFLGIFGAIGLAFFSEYLDHSIKTPEEVEKRLQLPALAYIPYVRSIHTKGITQTIKQKAEKKSGEKIVTKASEQWIVPEGIKEYYEVFKERLLLSSNGFTGGAYVLAIIGCHRGEGISTVAANLATTLSQNGDGHVLIVDAHVCHPSVHQIFKANLSPGLTDILINGQTNGDAIQSLPAQNLHILSAGTKNGSNSDIFNTDRFEKLLNSMKNRYRFIVIDVPALNETVSAARLASLCDGVVLVVEAEQLRWEVAQRTREQLVKSNVNVLGVVLNKRRFHVPGWLYRTL